jgi:chorismate-pyruvate lyase
VQRILIEAKEGKAEMYLKTSIQKLIRLSFEQPALLSGVFMTPLLEAYAGGPLQVRLISQQLRLLEAAVPELMLDQWEPILERKVLLQGIGNAITYLYAETLIVPGVLPAPVYTRLLQGEEPIGRILQELRLPTFREVIAHGRACIGDITDGMVAGHFKTGPGADVLYRTLLLYVNQRPQCAAMRITEVMPWAYVYDRQDGPATLAPGATGMNPDAREVYQRGA